MEKEFYLKKYRPDITFISMEEAKKELSKDWINILSESDAKVRTTKTLALWKREMAKELRNTILCLEDNLVDVELIKSSFGIAILYSIKFGNGEIGYYEGFIPKKENDYNIREWGKYPDSLKKFYTKLHNGFVDFICGTMGISPDFKIECFNDYEWEVIEDLNLNPEFSFDHSYIIFETGAGGNLLIDTTCEVYENSTVWFANRAPSYNVNMWDILDEWIIMGFGY